MLNSITAECGPLEEDRLDISLPSDSSWNPESKEPAGTARPFHDGFQSTPLDHQFRKRGRSERGGDLEISPMHEDRGWDALVFVGLLEEKAQENIRS